MQSIRLFALLFLLASSPLMAQEDLQFSILPGLGVDSDTSEKVRFVAEFRATADGELGELAVTAQLGAGWHIYSTTQQSGGPKPTRFEIRTDGIVIAGPFRPDRPPKTKHDPNFRVPLEEFADTVTWTAPIRISKSLDSQSLKIEGLVKGQICEESGSCILLRDLDPNFSASFAGTINRSAVTEAFVPSIENVLALAPTQKSAKPFRPGRVHATVEATIKPAMVKPGGTASLTVTLRPDEGWHVYDYLPKDPKKISKPTLIAISSPGWKTEKPIASSKPIQKKSGIPSDPIQRFHAKPITWTIKIQVPDDAKTGAYAVSGGVGYQTCTDVTCDPPTGATFIGKLVIGDKEAGVAALEFEKSKYATISKLIETGSKTELFKEEEKKEPKEAAIGSGFDVSKIVVVKPERPMATILLLAFVGGFVLNFMPCVLPVIGLKVMSFVQQAGEDRKKTLALNVVYSLGLLSIFWILALAASVFSLGWGEQFNNDPFTITILAVIFVMALSFLGVWEIPIPGFASSGKANELTEKEGYSGAFFKGVITTILATPCSGPGLASALAYCAGKPPTIVFLVFTFVGLGMAVPYLLIGAFPQLVRFIPKPGAWMDTFKQLMGFVLLGTVVYMFTFLEPASVIPSLAFLFALWFGCWWIGRTPITAQFGKKVIAWGTAVCFAGFVGYFAFGYDGSEKYQLPWERFSLASMEDLTESQQTVLVDFTADW